LSFIPCHTDGGDAKIVRVIDARNIRHTGDGLEIGENLKIHWTTLYDEILLIHEGSMIVRADQRSSNAMTAMSLSLRLGGPSRLERALNEIINLWFPAPAAYAAPGSALHNRRQPQKRESR
jgi:hypothetical protein